MAAKPKLIYVCSVAGEYYSNESSKPLTGNDPIWTQQTTPVCVLGNLENHELIRHAIEKRTNLFVGKYLTTAPPVTAAGWFKRMAHINKIPASLGGWKKLSPAGAQHYRSIRCRTQAEFQTHPAYKALAFCRSEFPKGARRVVPMLAAQRVLTTIGDPRWHATADGVLPEPGRFLRETLSCPDNFEHLLRLTESDKGTLNAEFERRYPKNSFQRAVLVTAGLAGKNGPSDAFDQQRSGKLALWNTDTWRVFTESGGVERYLQEFFRFVLTVWLDETDTRRLFVPEYYFDDATNTDVASKSRGLAYRFFAMATAPNTKAATPAADEQGE